jgi:hypothetical protein
VSVSSAAVAGRVTTSTSAPTAKTVLPAPGFGVTLPGAPTDLTALTALTTALAHPPSTVMWYSQWATSPDFPAAGATAVAATGAVPEITWEPWDPSLGIAQPAYTLASISSGTHDSYLKRWATQIHRYGKPLRLRFGHEMNGNWYPWAERVNTNSPGSYVAAWRHVHRVFANAGASNVTWVWSPNVSYTGSTPLAQLYPGDRTVDEVALDGYNWSTLLPWTTWQPFSSIFTPTRRQIAALTTRPLSIGETASTEIGGDKAEWISDLFDALAAEPQITGFTWFNWHKETDWRIDSSSSSLQAFRSGLQRMTRSSLPHEFR